MKTLLLFLLLSVSARAGTVTLAWDPNTEPDLAGYRVYQGTATGTYGPPLDVANVTTITLTVAAGKTYFFAVTAYNTAGLESPKSNEISFTAPAVAPAAPTTLRIVTRGTPGSSPLKLRP